jgi:hypothetical protein
MFEKEMNLQMFTSFFGVSSEHSVHLTASLIKRKIIFSFSE